jgi:hypothetical protein
MVERIERDGRLSALILRQGEAGPGVTFATTDDNSLQLAAMKHPPGTRVKPHVHISRTRIIEDLQEVLHIRSGKAEFEFYNDAEQKTYSIILNSGDTILLVSGGHGVNILEDTEMIEVKQGPYFGLHEDKRLF